MYRLVALAFASALLILVPIEGFARGGGGGGGHGGGGGFGGGHGGGFGGGFGGARGHMGPMFGGGPRGAVGFRAMPGAFHGARFNRHVVAHRFNHRRVFFVGGDAGYYYSCYPYWNGYAWVSTCDWGY